MNQILHGDNLALLRKLPSASAELIYIDPALQQPEKSRSVRA